MPVLYGSTVVDAALSSACDMATASGGTETTVNTAYGVGAQHYGEAYSQGSTNGTTWASIPATPTGNGWMYAPGIGSFALDNWSANIAFSDPTGPSPIDDITLRFFKYSGGGYTLIGTIVLTSATINTTRTDLTFAATSMPSTSFALGEYVYVDIWYHVSATNIGGIQPSVYVSTSSTAGVTNDLQVTTPAWTGDTVDPYTIVMYGAKVNDTTITTASKMAATPGGVEVLSASTAVSGTAAFGEVYSQGGSPVSVAAIPATPTGHGWVYKPGAGSFAVGNWSATFRVTEPTAGNYTVTPTVRFFKYSSGSYTLIGSILGSAVAFNGTTPVTWAFAGTSMGAVTFGANDLIYTDLWFQDAGGNAGGDNAAVELSTTATLGVALDAQVTTAVFTPAAAPLVKNPYLPYGVPRAFGGTITYTQIKPPLIYTPRAFGGTILTDSRTFVPRAFGGTYISDDPTKLWVPRSLSGTTQIPVSTGVSLSSTIPGVGTLAGTFSLATNLTDTIPGVGTLTGTMDAKTALSCTIPGVGTLTPTLSANTALATTIPGVGTLAGTFSANTSLSVTIPGIGTLSATLQEATALATTIPGVGTLSGTFSLATALTSTIPGIGTLTGTLSTTGGVSLAVTMAGVGTITGTMTLATALTVTEVGVGTLTPTLSANLALPSTTLIGAGTLAATLSAGVPLAVSLHGVGTLSGVFTLRVALSLTFAGLGTLSGIVTTPILSFLSATCVTRDMRATAQTRDMQATCITRDEHAAALQRDMTASALTRDEQAIAKTRS